MTQATAQVEKTIRAPPAQVWKALTTPEKLKKFFFGAEVASDWKVGSPITMRGEFKGKAYEDKGEILVIEPEAKLSFSHWSALSGDADVPDNYHVVSFELSPQNRGTRVTLTQSNLNGRIRPSDRAHKADYEKNWQGVLDGLANTVAKAPGA
jgi:uncharacterized protein YndB with AHSA1/START domain